MLRRRERRRSQHERSRREQYENEYEAPRRGNGIKQLVVLLTVAFMAALGVVIGTRLSSDAIAVLVGVIAGVAASIPCALLLMAVTRRRENRDDDLYDEEPERYPARSYGDRGPNAPPVIVVTQGQPTAQQLPPWASSPGNWNAWDNGAPARRQFRVMGDDESDDED
jgi:hypothetical protein